MPSRGLRTQRLELRPVAMADVDDLWPYVTDPEIPRFMTWEAHRDRSETEAFVTAMTTGREVDTNHAWTVRHNGTFCGITGLHQVTRVRRAWRMDCAELGYWCAPPLQRRGFTTEAAREVMRFGFRELGLHKISVGCATENVGSRRVIEKLGFRFVGEQRDHFFRDGRWWHHLMFEMLDSEYVETLSGVVR